MNDTQAAEYPVIAWLQSGWAVAGVWLALISTLGVALRNWYGAERDRQALKNSELEREKLRLEIGRLKHDPVVVAERRAIYERLRKTVHEMLRTANPTVDHVYALHDVRHDCEFRYPPEIVDGIKQLIKHAIDLHITVEKMQWFHSRKTKPEEWQQTSDEHHAALTGMTSYYESMVEVFRPYLSL